MLRVQQTTRGGRIQSPFGSYGENVRTLDTAHDKIHAGKMWFRYDWHDLAALATYDLLVVPPPDREAHMFVEIGTESEFTVALYRNNTITLNGTVIESFNRNDQYEDNARTQLFHTPTIGALGTNMGSIKSGSGKSIGGTVRSNGEIIMTKNHMFRVTNDSPGLVAWVTYIFDWYEEELHH